MALSFWPVHLNNKCTNYFLSAKYNQIRCVEDMLSAVHSPATQTYNNPTGFPENTNVTTRQTQSVMTHPAVCYGPTRSV